MNKLKKIILVLAIIIILLIFSIILLNNGSNEEPNSVKNIVNSNNVNNNITIYEDDDVIIETNEKEEIKLKYVNNRTNYFTIESIISNYISCAGYGENNELLNILSKDYIKQYNVTKNNVLEKIGISKIQNENNYYQYNVNDMLVSEQENNIKVYLAYGEYKLNSSSNYIPIKTMVLIDAINKKYEIYPEEYLQNNGYNNLSEESILNLGNVEILEESKQFSYVTKDDREVANRLFSQWKDYRIYNKSKAYDKLNTQYKNNKFNTLQKFESYLSTQKYIPIINEYRVYSTQNYTDYICTDQYNNYYIFRQQGGVMRYSVFLDNYTVELDTFKKNYKEANDETKVAIQIGKFKQMLNSKDYNAIYNKLNKTFKQNNYSTVAKLENYLKTNTYEVNTIEIDDIQENEDYYVCKCTLQNQKNKEEKTINIIIKLIDSNNFEISFSM